MHQQDFLPGVTVSGADPTQFLMGVLEGTVAEAEVNHGQQTTPDDDSLYRLSMVQLQGLLELMDKLGTKGVVKFARALERDGFIEGEYQDAGTVA